MDTFKSWLNNEGTFPTHPKTMYQDPTKTTNYDHANALFKQHNALLVRLAKTELEDPDTIHNAAARHVSLSSYVASQIGTREPFVAKLLQILGIENVQPPMSYPSAGIKHTLSPDKQNVLFHTAYNNQDATYSIPRNQIEVIAGLWNHHQNSPERKQALALVAQLTNADPYVCKRIASYILRNSPKPKPEPEPPKPKLPEPPVAKTPVTKTTNSLIKKIKHYATDPHIQEMAEDNDKPLYVVVAGFANTTAANAKRIMKLLDLIP